MAVVPVEGCSTREGNCNSGTLGYTLCVHDLGAIVGR